MLTRRVSVRGIVLYDNKLLCAKLKPYKGSLFKATDSYWCLPGGSLDEAEPLLAGIEREMIEETGIKPVVGKLLYVQQFTHSGKDYLEFFFHITNGHDYLNIDLSKTSHGDIEIAEIGFVDPGETYILPDFLDMNELLSLAQGDSPTQIISRL